MQAVEFFRDLRANTETDKTNGFRMACIHK